MDADAPRADDQTFTHGTFSGRSGRSGSAIGYQVVLTTENLVAAGPLGGLAGACGDVLVHHPFEHRQGHGAAGQGRVVKGADVEP